jgi:LacI family transcriptional regulator, galactose operon repressor
MSDDHRSKKVTIRDLADALGISRGTVDRAIHNRSGVNPGTREKVNNAARELGYSPNRLAQFLVTGKTIKIAFITLNDPLWQDLSTGAQAFIQGLGKQILGIDWHGVCTHGHGGGTASIEELVDQEASILKDLIESDVQGIVVVAFDRTALNGLIDKAVESGKAVVTMTADAPASKRLCFVGQDARAAGRLGGELMGKLLAGHGRVLPLVGFDASTHHNRLEAFREIIEDRYPGITIEGVREHHDAENDAYEAVRSHLSDFAPPDGIYLTSGIGPDGAVRALHEAGLAGTVRVVCYDFFRTTVKLLKKEWVHATIGQDPFRQGYQTMKILYDYIVDHKAPSSDRIFTKMDIGFRENIDILISSNQEDPDPAEIA